MAILKKANSYANVKQKTNSDLTVATPVSSAFLSKNFLINGNMDIWQRNTTFGPLSGFSSVTNYTADRFAYGSAGTTATMNATRQSDAPTLAESGYHSNYSLRLQPAVADAAVAAGDVAFLYQVIEGFNYQALKGKTVTLSFWVKSTLTGTYCVAFKNNGADRSYVAEYQITAANVWQRKSITLSINYSGGTDNFLTGNGLLVEWTLMCGTTFQTTAGAWQNGDFNATGSQVNFNASTSNQFYITQAMLSIDSEAVPFATAGIDFAAEVDLCERYYEKSYDLDTAVGTSASSGRLVLLSSQSAETDNAHPFRTRKRIAASITLHDSIGFSAGPVVVQNGQTSFSQNGSTAGPNQNFQFHWVADAEM